MKQLSFDSVQYALDHGLYNVSPWRVARIMLLEGLNTHVLKQARARDNSFLSYTFTLDGVNYVVGKFEKVTDILPTNWDTRVRLNYIWANATKDQKRQMGITSAHVTGKVPLNDTAFEIITSSATIDKVVRIIGAVCNSETKKNVRNFFIYMSAEQYVGKRVETVQRFINLLTDYNISIWVRFPDGTGGLVDNTVSLVQLFPRVIIKRTSDLFYLKSDVVREIYLEGKISIPWFDKLRLLNNGDEIYVKYYLQVPDDGRYIQDYIWEALAKQAPSAKVYTAYLKDDAGKFVPHPELEAKQGAEYSTPTTTREQYIDPEREKLMDNMEYMPSMDDDEMMELMDTMNPNWDYLPEAKSSEPDPEQVCMQLGMPRKIKSHNKTWYNLESYFEDYQEQLKDIGITNIDEFSKYLLSKGIRNFIKAYRP